MKENKISQAAEPDGASFRTQANPPHPIFALADQPDIRRLNAEVSIHSGYHVDAAADGAAARRALIADSYDLMITDNNMSRLTGAELLKKLRSARMALPVIMAAGTLPGEEFIRYPWLHTTFAPEQLAVFPQGGHPGNLSNLTAQKTVLGALAGLKSSPTKI